MNYAEKRCTVPESCMRSISLVPVVHRQVDGLSVSTTQMGGEKSVSWTTRNGGPANKRGRPARARQVKCVQSSSSRDARKKQRARGE